MSTRSLEKDTWPALPPFDAFAPRVWTGRRRAGRYQRWAMGVTLVVSDAAMVVGALLLAWYLRIGSGWMVYNAPGALSSYWRAVWMAVPLVLALLAVHHLYEAGSLLGGTDEYAGILRSCTYGMVGLSVLSFWEHGSLVSRGWLLMSWALTVVMVTGSRFGWRRLFRRLQARRGWLTTPTLIVGANEHARAIAGQLEAAGTGARIVGFVDDFLPAGTPVLDGRQVVGPPRLLQEIIRRHDVERVIVLPNAVAWETFHDIMRQAASSDGFDLEISPGFYEIATTSVSVTQRGFVPLLRVERLRIVGLDWVLKSAVDFGLGVLLVVLTAPLTVLIALALWLEVGWPIVERHRVLGLNGKPFQTTKFRTGLQGTVERCLDQPLAPTPPGAAEGATRCAAGLCRLLFRTGLDKLPQLTDVLRGRMSLVGPRTISVGREAQHEAWLSHLLVVKPGWTGPWAVSGASDVDAEMRLDLFYIRNWTIWVDLQLLYQTAKKVLLHWSRKAP